MGGFTIIETAVGINLVVPSYNFIDRSEPLYPLLYLTKGPLDLSIRLRMVHPCPDMPDSVILEEFPEGGICRLRIPG